MTTAVVPVVGLGDGAALGVVDGATLGLVDGPILGVTEGLALGPLDGLVLGLADGPLLGLADGPEPTTMPTAVGGATGELPEDPPPLQAARHIKAAKVRAPDRNRTLTFHCEPTEQSCRLYGDTSASP